MVLCEKFRLLHDTLQSYNSDKKSHTCTQLWSHIHVQNYEDKQTRVNTFITVNTMECYGRAYHGKKYACRPKDKIDRSVLSYTSELLESSLLVVVRELWTDGFIVTPTCRGLEKTDSGCIIKKTMKHKIVFNAIIIYANSE